jgi:L-ascorbate metabolism protein UlaG (beta-lactamase superfamily)
MDMLTLILPLLVSASLATDTVRLHYLGHSGWLIQTRTTTVLVDAVGITANGRHDPTIHPALPSKLPNLVVVSHGHPDHFSDQLVRSAIAAKVPVVLGHDIAAIPNTVTLRPRTTTTVGNIKLTAIESTDEGIGLLIDVDGFRIYHSGDHALWVEQLRQQYEGEIDWLAEQVGSVDVVLAAVATGMACEVRPTLLEGARYAAAKLKARWLVPMHVQCMDALPGAAAALRDSLKSGGLVVAPERVGSVLTFVRPDR